MIGEIIATGDEIRTGALVDSNSAAIAEDLEMAGVTVTRHHCVGDDLGMLAEIFQEVGRRADIVVVTGGLGPTTDDLTAAAAAVAAGTELVLDPVALAAIEAFFKHWKRPMTASNRKQALLPRGSKRLDNPVGTAPGFSVAIGGATFFCLPGVPPEMRRMLDDHVLPGIRVLQGENRQYRRVRTITTFGLTESATGEKVATLPQRFPGIKLGLRAKFPEIHVRLYGEGTEPDDLEARLEAAVRWVVGELGVHVMSELGESLHEVVGRLLVEQKATLAVAESCTGGLIASRLTDVPGSSDYFLLSAVTYANEAKVRVLGVSPETLDTLGAVHEKTAEEMADGARRVAGADYGLSVSGIAGPSGGTPEKPVGTVCIGLATPDGVRAHRYVFRFGQRLMNKCIFAASALDLLRRDLKARAGARERRS